MLSFLFIAGYLLGKDWPLGSLAYYILLCFVTFPCGILGQVWYLIVSIPDLCLLTYFVTSGPDEQAIFVSSNSILVW